MQTLHVSCCTPESSSRTTLLLAFVLLTAFLLIADSFTPIVSHILLLLLTHSLLLQIIRIVEHITLDFNLVFATPTRHLHSFHAVGTFALMAFLFALVETTGEEFVTGLVAHWDWICATFSLSAYQVDHFASSTRTKESLFRNFLTTSTRPLMA